MRHAFAAVLLLTGCAGGYVAGIPMPSQAMRPEDRVLLGDFSRVTAIASSFDRLYVAYPAAIGIYRPLQKRWEVPRSPSDPTLLANVVSAAIDPVDQSVWLGTSAGYIHYQPDIDRWETGVPPPAGLPRSPTINDAFADVPQLRSLSLRLLSGPRMVQGVFTAAAPNRQGTGWFLGTSNRGLLFFDRMASDAVPMTLGLPGPVVGAIAATAEGIWVVNDLSVGTPSAITFLSEDLASASPIAGSAVFGLPFDYARQVIPGNRALWLATDKGLVRASLDDGAITRWDTPEGLPDSRVTTIAQAKGAIVVGTMRGLVEVGADNKLVRRARSFDGPVYALKANGDTLWVGTSFGLYASLTADDSLRMPEGFRQQGAIPPVLGVGYVADTLVVMTTDHLIWRDPSTGAWQRGPDLAGALGQLVAFVATAEGAWVAGTRGVGLVRPSTPVLRPLLVGAELPAQVTSVAAQGDYLWVGTIAGLVRIRLVGR